MSRPAAQHVLTILAVTDLGRAARFYDAAFGWRREVDVPVYVEYEVPNGPNLGIYVREGFARNTCRPNVPPPSGATTGTEIYFRVEDVDDAVGRLMAAGASVLSPAASRDWGDRAAYLADPDGNVLVVAERG